MILKDRDRILIVGGGPAGTSLALFLMEEGVAPSSLLIVDKAYFPRDKLCGGVVTANGIQEILPFLPQGIFTSAYRIKGYLLKTPFGDLFVRETFDSFVYSRKDLDYFLLKEVEKRGVEILEGKEVKEFGWGREGVTVRFQTGSTHTFWGGIFADGALGVSRKIFPRRRYLPLVEGIFQGDDSFEKGKIFFDLTLPYEGVPVYRWVIPYFSRERYLLKVGAMGGKEDLKGEVLRKAVQSLVEGYGLSPVEDLHGWVLKPYSPFSPFRWEGGGLQGMPTV
jgi:flavin-dependent dehydrogenase